ncbi:hypothetical protein ACS0TY_015306 [Phlomoides rotata]
MLAAQPPLSGHHLIRRPKSGRRPLEPKNQPTITTNHVTKPAECVEISWLDDSNKENIPPLYSIEKQPFRTADESIDDEQSTIREKLERLMIEKDNNEKVLRERGLMLDLVMKEIVSRGEAQKQLEIEVDRLFRLNEIKLACMRVSRIRSLRDREEEKKMKQV